MLVKKASSAGTTVYVGQHYEVWIPASGSAQVTRYYVFGGRRIAMLGPGETQPSYLLPDALGSTVGRLTPSSLESERYYPYGNTRPGSSVGTVYQYTGQRRDSGLGLYDYGARWLDPTTGLWTQPDTMVPQPGDPKTLNRYAYALGDPLCYRDPSGHWPEWLDNATHYISGASAQYFDDVSLGAWSSQVLKTDLSLMNNDAYQSGRDLGRMVSTAQAQWEAANGIGIAIFGASAVPPTLAGGAACTVGSGGLCALPTGGALVVEDVMVVGGTAAAVHGTAMMVRQKGRDIYDDDKGSGEGGGGKDWVTQTGGNTITADTAKALGVERRVAGRALEALKKELRLPNNFHSTKIWSNGDVYHSDTGAYLGNLRDYLH